MLDAHLDLDARFARDGKGGTKLGQRGFIGPLADGAECPAHWTLVTDCALANDNMGIPIAELQPEHRVAGQSGEGAEATAKSGAEVIVIGRQRSGDDELCAIVAFQGHAHGLRERNLLVQESFGIAQEVVHLVYELERRSFDVSGLIRVAPLQMR